MPAPVKWLVRLAWIHWTNRFALTSLKNTGQRALFSRHRGNSNVTEVQQELHKTLRLDRVTYSNMCFFWGAALFPATRACNLQRTYFFRATVASLLQAREERQAPDTSMRLRENLATFLLSHFGTTMADKGPKNPFAKIDRPRQLVLFVCYIYFNLLFATRMKDSRPWSWWLTTVLVLH